ncbi:MAG: GTPase domain-containing protein [bacterium]|nr:GTPase domain-containing protein [bacterium]
MAVIDQKKKEISAKIVYYGPGLSGKTTNIHFIHSKLKPEHRGKLMTLATQTDRTLFFDYLPVELGEVKGMKTRFQIYTVPGQVFYNATRKLVLKNVDGIVFVADSQKRLLNENIDSLNNLEANLKFYNKKLEDIPIIFQYNKRDLPEILTVDELQQKLNKLGSPFQEAVASEGKSVLSTLTMISKMVLQKQRPAEEQPHQPSPFKLKEKPAAPPAAPPPAAASNPAPPAATPAGGGVRNWEIVSWGNPERVSPSELKIPMVIREKGKNETVSLKLVLNVEWLAPKQ